MRVQLLSASADLDVRLSLPDLASAICIKALAYRGRYADKDAVDLWRLMAAAHRAGLTPDAWPTTRTARAAALVLSRFFAAPSGSGLPQVSASRRDQAHMRALTRAVVGLAT